MVQRGKDSPWALLAVLLVVGGAAVSFALWLGYHPTLARNSGLIIAILFGTFFVCWGWALIAYLQWRDRRSLIGPVGATYSEELAGTV